MFIRGIPKNMHELYFKNYDLLAAIGGGNLGMYSYQFGPFYAVHDNHTSVDSILNESLNIHSVIKQFTNSTTSSSMVLYTYGYSGSGKTFTLFGDIKKETPDVENSTVLKMIKMLKDNGCTVSLERTLKCYGTLSQSQQNKQKVTQNTPTKYFFQDEVQVNEITSTMEEDSTWINKIKSELQHDKDPETGLTKPNSFIKATSNNPDSSRGFYILRFAITPPISISTPLKVRHYLGIVDMAGNEDPFDIQSVMLPTLGLDHASHIFNSQELFTNDIVYGEVITTLQNIFHPLLVYINTRKTNITMQPDVSLTNIPYTYFDKLNNYFKDVIQNWRKKNDQPYPKDEYVIIEDLIDVKVTRVPEEGKKALFTFHFSEGLILEILQKKIQSLQDNIVNKTVINDKRISFIEKLDKQRSQMGYNVDNEPEWVKALLNRFSMLDNSTLDTIRNRLAQTKVYDDELKYMILSNVLQNKDTIHITNKIFKANFGLFGDNITNPGSFKNMIATELIKYFAKQPYILRQNNNSVAHTPNTIASIIREGYYINQANAELMEFFKAKKNGDLVELLKEDNARTDNRKTQYEFESNFALSKYNKFKKHTSADATKATNANNANNNQYETQLVPTLRRLFTDGSKDIMFACLRDDKSVAIAKGAIDTLKLVQDIKST